MNEFGIEYKKEDQILVKALWKTSLKGLLLHNRNAFASLPVAHLVLIERNENLNKTFIGCCLEI